MAVPGQHPGPGPLPPGRADGAANAVAVQHPGPGALPPGRAEGVAFKVRPLQLSSNFCTPAIICSARALKLACAF